MLKDASTKAVINRYLGLNINYFYDSERMMTIKKDDNNRIKAYLSYKVAEKTKFGNTYQNMYVHRNIPTTIQNTKKYG